MSPKSTLGTESRMVADAPEGRPGDSGPGRDGRHGRRLHVGHAGPEEGPREPRPTPRIQDRAVRSDEPARFSSRDFAPGGQQLRIGLELPILSHRKVGLHRPRAVHQVPGNQALAQRAADADHQQRPIDALGQQQGGRGSSPDLADTGHDRQHPVPHFEQLQTGYGTSPNDPLAQPAELPLKGAHHPNNALATHRPIRIHP